MSYDLYRSCVGWHRDQLAQIGVRVIAQPDAEPVTLDEARQHLRLDAYGSPAVHPDDAVVAMLLAAAREWCEGDLGLSLAPQVLEIGRSEFGSLWTGWSFADNGGWVALPFGPVTGISSALYLDGDGVEQALDPSAYVLDAYSRPARLYAAPRTSWPATYAGPNAVRVRYTAGYSLPGDSPMDTEPLPYALRAMVLLVLGHLYERRENTTELRLMELPLGASALGTRYRVRLGMA